MILCVRAMFHAMFHAFIKMCIIQSFCMSCSSTTTGIWLLSVSTLYVCFTYIMIMTCPSFSSVSKYYNEAPQLQNQYIQAHTQRFKRGFLVLPSRQSKMWGFVEWAHRLWQNCGISAFKICLNDGFCKQWHTQSHHHTKAKWPQYYI